ncbi:subclass B3 metallo-beta-lactamase [Novosphingobium sp.]|uniref:subclass B3 metallo-beta-lactamase n=1 Tax=Novosphingobium sp. TaxID=1874826 RepID=UPI0038BA181E
MFGKAALAVAGAMFAQTFANAALAAAPASPLPADTAGAKALMAVCAGKEDFSDPAPPVRIFGNVWYVGTCTVSAILLTSRQGHVLIDATTQQAAPAILANIRAAGFRPKDVRWIVTSHEHFDHVGGLAALKAATGARVASLRAAVPALESGKVSPADPQAQEIGGFAPVKVARVLRSGDAVMAGPLRLTALATPGHTEGSTSWRWTSCEQSDCRHFTYVDSLSALPLGTYRFADHPDRVALFRSTIRTVRKLDCGILVTPHPSSSDLFERMAGQEPLQDKGACRALADAAEQRLEKALKP